MAKRVRDIEKMTDSELYKELVNHDIPAGPVVG
jgi:hypothetical protein